MRRVRIAQIGTSTYSHGPSVFDAIKRSDRFYVAGFALPENERTKFPERMCYFGDYKELTLDEILNNPEIEAVAIETEEKYLTKYAALAALHGKHIHMEKPGGTDLAEFERLIELVKKNKKVFHTGYMYRYNPYISNLIKRIKQGELGDIISIEAQMNCFHTKEVRQWLREFPGGMMFFLGCHLVDLVLQIQGMPEKIIPLNKCSGVDGVAGGDFGMAVFEYKNGVSTIKTSAVERGGYLRRQLVISGTKGTVEIRPLEMTAQSPLLATGYREVFGTEWGADAEFDMSQNFDRLSNMLDSFAAMVCGETENPLSYDYELQLYKTILKCCGENKGV